MSSKNYKYTLGIIGLLFVVFGAATYIHPTTYYHGEWKGESPLIWVGFGIFLIALSLYRFMKRW